MGTRRGNILKTTVMMGEFGHDFDDYWQAVVDKAEEGRDGVKLVIYYTQLAAHAYCYY